MMMYNMDILLSEIREHHGRFFGLREKSYDDLISFLEGYDKCYRDINNISFMSCSHKLLPGFKEFLLQYYKMPPATAIRWDDIIRQNTESDAAAYDTFFELYAFYRKLPPIKFDTLYLTINWFRLLNGAHTLSRFLELLEWDFPWFCDKNAEPDERFEMRFFGDYIKAELHVPDAENWKDAIYNSAKSDEDALKLFFKLFDRFSAQRLKNK